MKESAKIYRVGKLYVMKNRNGNIISDEASIIYEWTRYIEELFNDNEEMVTVGDELQSEVASVIKHTIVRKAPGPDGMLADFLKVIDKDSIKKVIMLFNQIYSSGEITEQWLQSKFVHLPKKTNEL